MNPSMRSHHRTERAAALYTVAMMALLTLPMACTRTPSGGHRVPPPGLCPPSVTAGTACGVPTFSPRIQGPGNRVLVGASGLAMLDGTLFTVLEASGVGDGLHSIPASHPAKAAGATGIVRGVLFRTDSSKPTSWRPLDIVFSAACHTLISALAGDHRRTDVELESIDVRRGPQGGVRIAVGSDFGYVATGHIQGDVATLSTCTTSIRELPNNKAFEAVTLPREVTGALMVFEEKPFRADTADASTPRRYRRQWLGGAAPDATRLPSELHAPKRPTHCKKVPRVAGSARVGSGTVVIMSCKHDNSGYRYFLGATAPGHTDLLITALNNDRFGRLTPNLEGLASSGRCTDPLWLIADDHNSAGAPTVLATTPVPLAFRRRLGCATQPTAR